MPLCYLVMATLPATWPFIRTGHEQVGTCGPSSEGTGTKLATVGAALVATVCQPPKPATWICSDAERNAMTASVAVRDQSNVNASAIPMMSRGSSP